MTKSLELANRLEKQWWRWKDSQTIPLELEAAAELRRLSVWVGLSEEEKDTQKLIDNGLLFNDAERQVWGIAIEWAEETLRNKNRPKVQP